MRLAIFGLTISSTWGNGHATLWRGLIGALAAQGHAVTFFERDVPYYAAHRDVHALPDGAELVLYETWDPAAARHALARSDAAIVTSYCPDAAEAVAAILGARVARCFYDLDTPVTLDALSHGQDVPYADPGLRDFDLLLSYTGGAALTALTRHFGVRAVPIYGCVDPSVYAPAEAGPQYRAALAYLGTFARDRQAALERMLVEPARRRPGERFVIGGAQYPADFPWTPNIHFVRHLPASEHAAFHAAARLELNVTRAAMAAMGWCPSGRLFEAAACGTALVSDTWDGLDAFFEPGRDILVARDTDDVMAAMDLPDAALARIGRHARERVLAEHTADRRARQLVAALESAMHRQNA